MSTDHEHADDHEHDHDARPATDEMHDNSWSVNLEKPEHAGDRERIVDEALSAIEHTAPGYHVNLVTHGDAGHPEAYLFSALEDAVPDLDWEYVEQCGCGGHVTRVHV